MIDFEPSGRTLTIFITGGDPRSLRTVELDNWSGMAVMGRAEYFKRAIERDELSRSSLYLLVHSAGADDIPEVYVGETDDFQQRYSAAPFPIVFDNFIVFTNKDDRLTRAHVKWLELRTWELLNQNAGNVAVANKSKPTGSKLPESEAASMRTFFYNMMYVLEALGFEFFSIARSAPLAPPARESPATEAEEGVLYFTNTLPRDDSAKARLVALADGYVLKAGSAISKVATDSIPANVKKLRDQLIHAGDLAEESNCYVLKKDIEFARPSPASALVKGRSSTGYLDWIRESDRKRLGDVVASTG